jgi:hypothetical protein
VIWFNLLANTCLQNKKQHTMKPYQILFSLILFSTSVFADSPKFQSAKFVGGTGGSSVTVAFKETGLGNNQNITYTLAATWSVTVGCINKGDNHPHASNKEKINTGTTAGGTFSSDNGNVQASLTALAPTIDQIHITLQCPSGQPTIAIIDSPSFVSATLADDTNHITVDVPFGK